MASYYRLVALLPLVSLGTTSPVEPRQLDIYHPCTSCFRSSWTQGPECKTDARLVSTKSRILNPPADATSTYTPSQFCSAYLRQTDWTTFKETTTTISTYTDHQYTQPLITKTDYSHPTSTALCPLPSPNMECGWDTHTIAPDAQQQDWSVSDDGISTPEECHQACLIRPACKAYQWDARSGNPCAIFNVAIGRGAANLINPTPSGSEWWDRGCQMHLPTGCKKSSATGKPAGRRHAGPVPLPVRAAKPAPAAALITPAPAPVPAPEVVRANDEPALAKRDAPLPPYLEDLEYVWSKLYIAPACSCIISSAPKPVGRKTTTTFTRYTATVSTTTTFVDPFTVTVTPRETTVYVSVN